MFVLLLQNKFPHIYYLTILGVPELLGLWTWASLGYTPIHVLGRIHHLEVLHLKTQFLMIARWSPSQL
jgi:hypothetical protein